MRILRDMVTRHNRHTEQSRFTAEEAWAWAWEHYKRTSRWPRARFRVVAAGLTSRLLTGPTARKQAVRYNGTVEMIIPTATEAGVPRQTKAVREATHLEACARCKVEEGKPCVNKAGNPCLPHKVRVRPAPTPQPIDVSKLARTR